MQAWCITAAIAREQPLMWRCRSVWLAGKVLGAGMAEAVGSLISSSQAHPTAAQLAKLLLSRDATTQAAAAAEEASAQAAAATAPAATKPFALNNGTAAAAVASLDGSDSQQARQHQPSRQTTLAAGAKFQSGHSTRNSARGSHQHTPTTCSEQQLLQHCGLDSSSSHRAHTAAACNALPTDAANAAAAPGASRRSTGTLGSYAALTVVTGAESQPNSTAGCHSHHSMSAGSSPASNSHAVQTAAAAAGAYLADTGPRQTSAAAGCRSPSLLNPAAARPATAADGQQQQQHEVSAAADARHSSSPGRSSRLHSSGSRCSNPAPALSPGTPQGRTASSGLCSPAGSAGANRDVSPSHAVRPSTSSSGQRQSTAQLLTPAASPAAGRLSATAADDPNAASHLLHVSSRLASATGQAPPGSPQHGQQHPALLQDDPLQEQQQSQLQSELPAADGDDDGAAGSQQLSSLYGLSLAAAICMADLVRQVSREPAPKHAFTLVSCVWAAGRVCPDSGVSVWQGLPITAGLADQLSSATSCSKTHSAILVLTPKSCARCRRL